MKAAYIKQLGGDIYYGDFAEPRLKADEVLVKVEACAVNYVDTFVYSGSFQTNLTLPFVLGRDAVGIVERIGSNVDAVASGERVWTNSMGYEGRPGVIAEKISLPQNRLFKAPEGIDPIILAASVHSAATAAIILADVMAIKPQQTLLVEGAAGHVGTKLVELAASLGAQVITTANPKDFSRLKQLGATACYDYHAEMLFSQIKTDYPIIERVIDTSGKVSLQENLNLAAQKGEVTLITAPVENSFTFNVRAFYTQSQKINGFVISHASLTELQRAGAQINQAFANGQLLEENISVHSFAETAWVYQHLAQLTGKVVLVP